ncbi:MAG: class I SAM-dependent methyltransferase [Bradyrhizobiaceae bacterium]|nr:class I SAM-dependent methyltransferase [Bradyrhizobiaceae bacterium]
MDRWLKRVLSRLVREGTLRISTRPGRRFEIGDGTGEPVEVAFKSPMTLLSVMINPELKLGECYMDGSMRIERGSIADFLDLLLSQPLAKTPLAIGWAIDAYHYVFRRLAQFNPRGRSRRNVAHHYDLDGRLYSLFLDSDQQYSCAYFEQPDASLDDAQLAKKRHLAAKLLMDRPGLSVLDVGSGWGGLAIYLAEVTGARVLGVTLSEEQFAKATNRAQEKRLDPRVRFKLEDYRDVRGPFDRIVSVGMFEHVGITHYDGYFRKIAELLKEDGVAVIHSIGRSGPPTTTARFISKYIFPGGYIPALSEVLPAIQRSGLIVTDVEILRLHYAETLKAWRARFLARKEEVLRLYDEKFVRMWEFYLAASEMSFRHRGLMVFQIQLARNQKAAPLTRDYIGPAEERLRIAERGQRAPFRLAGE